MSIWQRLVVLLSTVALAGGPAAPVLAAPVLAAPVPAVPVPAAPVPVAPASQVDHLEDLDAFVAAQQERTGVPGTAYAVVSADGVEHAATSGTDGRGEPVTERTPFLWGSVSKPVAATLVVLLAEDGILDLDDPVVDHLPDFATADPVSRRATVRQLLTHTSGLPEGLELTDRYDPGRTPADVVAEIAGVEPVAAPGERHSYSSLGYVVLAALVTEVTGSPFGEVLADRVLGPARMSGVPADPGRAAEVLPPGHRYVAGSPQVFDSDVDPTGQAAGYLVGSLADAAAFARVHLDGGPVLDDRQRDLLHTAQVATGEDAGYGLGWRTSSVPATSEPMVWHGGAVPGYTTAVVLLPDRDRAVVVLQDAYGPFQEAALLDTAFGLAALLVDEDPVTSPTDPLYPGLLVGLGVLGVGLGVAAGRRVRRLGRPAPSRPRRPRVLLAGARLTGLVAVVALLVSLPRVFGVPLGHLSLWAPDIAWLLVGDLALCALLAVLGAAALVGRRLTRRDEMGR